MADKDRVLIEDIERGEYKYGFTSDIDTETIGRGLDEDVIRLISEKKGEPEWMLERRLKAYRHWLTMKAPTWAHLTIPDIDFQDIIYYAAPKPRKKLGSMDEVDPELKRTFDRLGIPLEEQMALAGVAVDAVMDSVSVKTTFRETLAEKGIIFCSISEAVREYPDLVQRYLGSVVPYTDNFYAALNAAVFSDGSFCYVPKGVRCPMELSTYFRINAEGTGQFERTLLVADEGAYVSYLEGCTAPRRDENQLHAAVVEITGIPEDATVQLLDYPGDRVDFYEGATVGVLSQEYRYGDGADEVIPAGTLVILGTYRGDPTYNTVELEAVYNTTGEAAEANGVTTITRPMNGYGLLFAEIPADGAVSDTSDGFFIFVPDLESEEDLNTQSGVTDPYPLEIRANFYRTDDPNSAGSRRLTSQTLWISFPAEDTLPAIELTSGAN